MATTLDDLCEGECPEKIIARLSELGEELKALKIQLASRRDSSERGGNSLSQVDELSSAMMMLQKAMERAGRAGKLSPEVSQALSSHLNSDPMPGEGS